MRSLDEYFVTIFNLRLYRRILFGLLLSLHKEIKNLKRNVVPAHCKWFQIYYYVIFILMYILYVKYKLRIYEHVYCVLEDSLVVMIFLVSFTMALKSRYTRCTFHLSEFYGWLQHPTNVDEHETCSISRKTEDGLQERSDGTQDTFMSLKVTLRIGLQW